MKFLVEYYQRIAIFKKCKIQGKSSLDVDDNSVAEIGQLPKISCLRIAALTKPDSDKYRVMLLQFTNCSPYFGAATRLIFSAMPDNKTLTTTSAICKK